MDKNVKHMLENPSAHATCFGFFCRYPDVTNVSKTFPLVPSDCIMGRHVDGEIRRKD